MTPATGAYGFAMANNYNGSRRPPVVFVKDGDARVVVRRETYDDLFARDVAMAADAARLVPRRPARPRHGRLGASRRSCAQRADQVEAITGPAPADQPAS